jgi:hypothetical protein
MSFVTMAPQKTGLGEVGTYAMCGHIVDSVIAPGATVDGGDLMYHEAQGVGSSGVSCGVGTTWQCMGYIDTGAGNEVSIFVRIA